MMELKPCPFCGADATLMEAVGETWVKCTKCHSANGLGTSDHTKAADAWNTRSSDQRITELESEVAELRAKLAAAEKDAARWKVASTNRQYGITNWCEFGQRTSYGEFAEKIIDAAMGTENDN